MGEFITAKVFDIKLAASATERAIDGHFVSGPLVGRSVNVKWYGARDLLDITPAHLPDFYLVLAAPRSPASSSRGRLRPWCIESVHLFDAPVLVAALRERGVNVGIATSVTNALWRAADLHPEPRSTTYTLPDKQRAILQLFLKQRGGMA